MSHAKTLGFGAALLLGTTLSMAAQTTSLSVPNFSFEDPGITGDDFVNRQAIPNWIYSSNPEAEGTYDNPYSNAPAGTVDGTRVAFINISNTTPATIQSAQSVVTIAAGDTYQLTVAVGNPPLDGATNYADPGNVYLALLAQPAGGGTPVVAASTLISDGTIPNDEVENFSVNMTSAESAEYAGDNLLIQMEDYNPNDLAGIQYQTIFDNVRLDETVVPEPATWMLMFMSFGLLGLVRRQLRA